MNKKGTIFALTNAASKGKTETLRALANLLVEDKESKALWPLDAIIPEEGDFRLVIQIEGYVIAIESAGDYDDQLKKCLLELVEEHKAFFIFCACRTKGRTPQAVGSIAQEKDFQIIWNSTYIIHDDKETQKQLNELKSRHLRDLLYNRIEFI